MVELKLNCKEHEDFLIIGISQECNCRVGSVDWIHLAQDREQWTLTLSKLNPAPTVLFLSPLIYA
jgi:hypothetical protein